MSTGNFRGVQCWEFASDHPSPASRGPGVGSLTALAFVLIIGRAERNERVQRIVLWGESAAAILIACSVLLGSASVLLRGLTPAHLKPGLLKSPTRLRIDHPSVHPLKLTADGSCQQLTAAVGRRKQLKTLKTGPIHLVWPIMQRSLLPGATMLCGQATARQCIAGKANFDPPPPSRPQEASADQSTL